MNSDSKLLSLLTQTCELVGRRNYREAMQMSELITSLLSAHVLEQDGNARLTQELDHIGKS